MIENMADDILKLRNMSEDKQTSIGACFILSTLVPYFGQNEVL